MRTMNTGRNYKEMEDTYGKDALKALINKLDSIIENTKPTAKKAETENLKSLLLKLENTQQNLDSSLTSLCQKIETLTETPNPTDVRPVLKPTWCRSSAILKTWEVQAVEIEKLNYIQHHLERTLHHYERRIDGLETSSNIIVQNKKSAAYFGQLLGSAKVVDIFDWMTCLEKKLSPKEIDHVLSLDLVIKGRIQREIPQKEAFVAVAAKETLNERDLERTCRRAKLLRKAGLLAIPLIASETVDGKLLRKARDQHAAVIAGGAQYFWEESQRYYLENANALV